jgi:galactokinase
MAAGHIQAVLRRATAAFASRFGGRPTWAASAPGRVNLIGEHTDYSGGFVLPIAIDRACIAVGAPAKGRETRVFSVDLNAEAGFDLTAPLRAGPEAGSNSVARGSWPSYVAGVAAQFQRLPGLGLVNLDIVIASSVPVGSGLSSSASLEVAVATVLEESTGVRLQPERKALLCQAAEHEFAGVPCGIMDQFISVMGRAGYALLIDCRAQRGTTIPGPAGASVVVINTNIHHALASGEYAVRKAACVSAAGKLGVPELRDVGGPDVESAGTAAGLSDIERRCVRHVVGENARVLEAAAALRAGDLRAFGRLMLESHASLRDDYRVSCPELDTVVDAAQRTPGVFGARMTGGGFGGCAIAMVEPGAVENLTERVGVEYQARHGRDCSAFVVEASDGAAPVSL